MSLPMSRPATHLSVQAPGGFNRSESKQLMRLQNTELTHGLAASTRVQAGAMVAAVGIQCAGMLSREATFQADNDPATANRLSFILDQFAALAGSEVARFGH